MEELVIEVERRTSTGKGINRKLRQQGLIPAVVYGGGKEPVPVVIDRHAVTELLRQEMGLNTVFLLKMKGTTQQRHAMLREAQIHPLTRQYSHIDFIRVTKGQLVKVAVPIHLDGEPIGVKSGGFLDWIERLLHIECAAESIPPSFRLDISGLDVGDHIAAGAIPLPEGVKLLDDAHKILVTVEAHGTKATAEDLAAEAAAAEAAAAETTEPEVIKRGKAVAEEAEE
jgi:large subunit ribosomal protein L25